MSRPELILMSQRERDRLKVLQDVRQGQLSQKQAARTLAMRDRRVRKLLYRARAEGDRGIVHRLQSRIGRNYSRWL